LQRGQFVPRWGGPDNEIVGMGEEEPTRRRRPGFTKGSLGGKFAQIIVTRRSEKKKRKENIWYHEEQRS